MLFRRNENKILTLDKAKKNTVYTINKIDADDKLKNFLLTLGCYEEEEIVLVSKLSDNYVVNIKDSRFALDKNMAKQIVLN